MSKENAKSAATVTQAAKDPPTHEEDPILSLSEVGRQVNRTHTTVARWVQDGLLNAIRLPGGRIGVRRSVVNTFLGGSALPTKEVV